MVNGKKVYIALFYRGLHIYEQWLHITFEGDINNFQCEYESYLWDLMMD